MKTSSRDAVILVGRIESGSTRERPCSECSNPDVQMCKFKCSNTTLDADTTLAFIYCTECSSVTLIPKSYTFVYIVPMSSWVRFMNNPPNFQKG